MSTHVKLADEEAVSLAFIALFSATLSLPSTSHRRSGFRGNVIAQSRCECGLKMSCMGMESLQSRYSKSCYTDCQGLLIRLYHDVF